MNAKELFLVAIKVLGLLALGRGVNDLLYVLLYAMGLSGASVTAKAPNADFVYGLFYFLIGLYFLRGAPLIVNFAYPNEVRKNDLETEEK